MKRTTIKAARFEGKKHGPRQVIRVDWPAYTSATWPGLAVHRTLERDGAAGEDWTVTHIASGCSVNPRARAFSSRRHAAGFAYRIAGLTDWTASQEDLQRNPPDPDIMRAASLDARSY